MNFYDITVKYINSLLGNKSPRHFEKTVYWIKFLYPKADEALLIAGYSHDIERLVSKKNTHESKSFPSEKELEEHQILGGSLMKKYLVEKGADEILANKVNDLISKHEIGGSMEQNILKDADSLSYFEVNAPIHASWINVGFPKNALKDKFDWMFNRISSPKAKEIAEPYYKNALKMLR